MLLLESYWTIHVSIVWVLLLLFKVESYFEFLHLGALKINGHLQCSKKKSHGEIYKKRILTIFKLPLTFFM